MKHYYYSYLAPEGPGFGLSKQEGPFDVAGAVQSSERTITIMAWQEITVDQYNALVNLHEVQETEEGT